MGEIDVGSSGLSREMLTELQQEDPEMAAVVQQEPAVPVQDQPPEVTSKAAERVKGASSLDEAREEVRRFIVNPDVADAAAFQCRLTQ